VRHTRRSWGVETGDGHARRGEPPSPTARQSRLVFGRIGERRGLHMIAGGRSRGPHLWVPGRGPDGETKIRIARASRVGQRGSFRGVEPRLRCARSGEAIEPPREPLGEALSSRRTLRRLESRSPEVAGPLVRGERWADRRPAVSPNRRCEDPRLPVESEQGRGVASTSRVGIERDRRDSRRISAAGKVRLGSHDRRIEAYTRRLFVDHLRLRSERERRKRPAARGLILRSGRRRDSSRRYRELRNFAALRRSTGTAMPVPRA